MTDHDSSLVNSEDALIKQHTMHWVRSFVIEYNICPFARHVVEHETLRIHVTHVHELDGALDALMAAIHRLDGHSEIETLLLVFPSYLTDFFDYLDFVDLAEEQVAAQGYDGIYQLATFHPDYCFAGVSMDDVSNYTNRSPYPMLHLLRETSVDKAISYHGNTAQIPDDNIDMMQKLGLEKVKKILERTGYNH